jgi:hypothetical protein
VFSMEGAHVWGEEGRVVGPVCTAHLVWHASHGQKVMDGYRQVYFDLQYGPPSLA